MKKILISIAIIMCSTSAFAMSGMDTKSANINVTEEVMSDLDQKMMKMDANHSMFIEKHEFYKSGGDSLTFFNMDANHDGKISKSEMMTDMNVVLVESDADARPKLHDESEMKDQTRFKK